MTETIIQRDVKINSIIRDVELETDNICDNYKLFTDGFRMLILMERKKDGGHNKEESRSIITRFTFGPDSFKKNVKEILLLQKILYPTCRLYLSVNPRNMKKVIRSIETDLLYAHYSDDENRDNTHKKLIRSPRHWVMQQSNSDGSLFIIDVDDVEGRDIQGEALKKIEEIGVEIIHLYKTKNGWHIVTNPFNPNLWDNSLGEIKKDALLLLKW